MRKACSSPMSCSARRSGFWRPPTRLPEKRSTQFSRSCCKLGRWPSNPGTVWRMRWPGFPADAEISRTTSSAPARAKPGAPRLPRSTGPSFENPASRRSGREDVPLPFFDESQSPAEVVDDVADDRGFVREGVEVEGHHAAAPVAVRLLSHHALGLLLHHRRERRALLAEEAVVGHAAAPVALHQDHGFFGDGEEIRVLAAKPDQPV